jgi:diguanylate cyclase (GGDEF)-like protein
MSESSSDPGAGVFSLSQIRHLMRVEFGRAQRYGYPLSCLVIGIDRLDSLRDLYGYDFRESVLEAVIELLQEETRTCDYLGRLMDDRLMAILPHTTAEGAQAGARRILTAARRLSFQPQGAAALGVSLSIGISHYQDDNTLFFDSLVEAAEGALGEAAKGGGDRFVHRVPGPREARSAR